MPNDMPPAHHRDATKARGRHSVTLRDVARLAGVSMMTVSRAIRTPAQVSENTRERVAQAVGSLGYVPNLMANHLRSARSYLVTALVPTITGSLFSQMVESLTGALEARGYQLMVGQSGYADSREDDLLQAIVGRRPDGIVLTGILHSPEGRRMLSASGIPVVETWDTTDQPIDMLIGLSHDAIGEAVCRYLFQRGKRRPALLCGDDTRARKRHAGFVRAAAALGLDEPPIHFVPSPTTHALGRQGLRSLLAIDPRIDAVFCSSDMMAAGVLTEAVAGGLSVPGRLAVVGFGDLEFAASMSPALTSVRIDGGAIGSTAADMIAARADGRPVERKTVDIGFSIVGRDSA
ncbi:LacI family DNA-binding transcriptional regulator [Xylophilus sp. Kf1]|nr:LacI family DNA-binding transcriptional regulator [Xylophilus sp. Kf1]